MPNEMRLQCKPVDIEPKLPSLLTGLGQYVDQNIPVVLALEIGGMTVLASVKAVSVTGEADGSDDNRLVLLWAGSPIGTTTHNSDEGVDDEASVSWPDKLEV